MKTKYRILSLLLAAVAPVVLAGCSSVEESPPVSSCHSYFAPSSYGTFSAQQAAKGSPIMWGAYPNAQYSGTWYNVSVYANGTKIDGKSQNYPPHGSVSAARAKKYSGKILELSGTVTNNGDVVLVFDMQCRIM